MWECEGGPVDVFRNSNILIARERRPAHCTQPGYFAGKKLLHKSVHTLFVLAQTRRSVFGAGKVAYPAVCTT